MKRILKRKKQKEEEEEEDAQESHRPSIAMVSKRDKKFKKRKKQKVKKRDRFTDLPDSIIHHIFSFLPTFIPARMSVLCKRLRDVWISNNSVLNITSRPGFSKFLDNYLRFQNLEILQRFKLDMKFYGIQDDSNRINRWLSTILDRSELIKEMDICVKTNYCLNCKFLNSKSLTFLKLQSLMLEALSPVSLPSLKTASLKSVTLIGNQTIPNLLLGCPSIEDLILDSCFVPHNVVVVSSSNLESIEIHNPVCKSWKTRKIRIRIEAVNLESFVFGSAAKFEIILFACERLRKVWISKVVVDNNWLESLLLTNSQIENLRFDFCGFKCLNIQSQLLRVLVLCGCKKEDEVEDINIDTPNLVSFTIEGWENLPTKFSIKAPNLFEISIKLVKSNGCDTNSFLRLMYFLHHFEDFKGRLNLEAQEHEALLMPRELKEWRSSITWRPLPNLKHLNVRGPCWTRNPEWREVMLFLSSPSLETLSVDGNLVAYSDFAMTS